MKGLEGLKLAIWIRNDGLIKSLKFRIKKAYYRIRRKAKVSILRFI